MQFAKLAKIVGGILGFLAAVFAIIQGIRDYRPSVPQLQAAVVNVEHVSSRTEIPDVKISLAFKNQSVPDLWLCRVRFQNIGGVTLYTTGSRPNTQSPIVISVPEKYEILQIEPKGIDPKDSGFEAQIRQRKDDKGVADKHQLEVTFEQWRKGEAIEAVLYLAGSDDHLDRPRLIPKGRPILDGDVVPVDLSTISAQAITVRARLFDRSIGPLLGAILRIFAILCLCLIAVSAPSRKPFPSFNWQQEHPVLWGILKAVLLAGFYVALFEMMP